MENIYLEQTEDTPQVILNNDDKEFSISGRSLPENAVAFYLPIIDWLNKYGNEEASPIVFDFRLDYFNTASAKQITKVLLVLQKLTQHINVKVRWYYLAEDTDIKSSGLRFSKLIKVAIELVEYDD